MNESHEQLLISRLTGGDATDQEWNELQLQAEIDPKLWRQLAEAQRDHIALMQAIGGEVALADRILIPNRPRQSSDGVTSRPQLRRAGAWTGWAVAAAVAILASIQTPHRGADSSAPIAGGMQAAGFASASEAFQTYLDKGRESGQVIGEVPSKVLLESRPAASGQGYEVIYLRQVMECTIVPQLYQINGQNELGQPTLARYEQPVRRSM